MYRAKLKITGYSYFLGSVDSSSIGYIHGKCPNVQTGKIFKEIIVT